MSGKTNGAQVISNTIFESGDFLQQKRWTLFKLIQ